MKVQFTYKLNLLQLSIAVFFVLFFISCAPNRNLVYFSNLPKGDDFSEVITNAQQARIQAGDLLGITISTLNPEYNQLFRSGSLPSTTSEDNMRQENNNLAAEGFLVSENGTVNLPVLGETHLVGLTSKQAIDKITNEVAKTAKSPIVNVRFLNYKVTVLGEVTKPGSFGVANEKINVLEALGLAGDMTAYGLRENVLVIREKEGTRTIKTLDLNNKDVFNSPYFQLQQNDVVYVQPSNKEKTANTNAAVNYPKIAIGTAIISAIAVVLATLIR